MSDGRIAGFEQRRIAGDGVELDVLIGGSGPPLLLLHGWPQTRMCWAHVAPELARRFTVVVPDLRGYGRSEKPLGGGDHAAYSKRTLALDQIATMKAFGFSRFSVAGHDRGGRVAYRLALDHPEAIERLAVLDIVPTSEMWALMDAPVAVGIWHWTFQIPEELPERLIGADPEFFLRYILGHQSGGGFVFDPACFADYLACLRDPATIHGMCEDYRAGWTIDRVLDTADKGVKRISAPMLCLWGERGIVAHVDPLRIWSAWTTDLRGNSLPCGHFMPEEASRSIAETVGMFMAPPK